MVIYFYENYKDLFPQLKGSMLTDRIIEETLFRSSIKYNSIKRTSKGKPLVNSDEEVFVSVSHSGSFFACVVTDQEVGLDIQQKRKTDIHKISQRYFAEDEIKYVSEKSEEGFYKLWTRKEAFSKYTGRGLEDVMSGASVLNVTDVDFIDFKMGNEIYCSLCIRKEGDRQYEIQDTCREQNRQLEGYGGARPLHIYRITW